MKYFVAVLPFLLALMFSLAAQSAPAFVGQYACVVGSTSDDVASLRAKPGQDSEEIGRLEPGSALQVTDSQDGWVNVDVIGARKVSGWIDARFLSGVDDPAACAEAAPGVVTKGDTAKPAEEKSEPDAAGEEFACVANLAAGDFLTLREKPSSRSGELARLADGSALRVIGAEGSWAQVVVLSSKPGSGWVNAKYLVRVDDPAACTGETAVNEEPVPVPVSDEFACVANLKAGDFLTLREKPSANAGQIDHLLIGTPLRVTGMDGTWYSVDVLRGEPESGWVNGKYVEQTKDAESCKGESDTAETTKPGSDEGPVGDEPIDPDTLCDQAADLDPDGNAIIPTGAIEITLPALVVEPRGLVSDLYPGLDTTTDAFYGKLPCEPSIGGTLPDAVNTEPTKDEIEIEAALEDFEGDNAKHIAEDLQVNPMPALISFAPFAFGPCTIDLKTVPCDSPRFLQADQPFEGRDIIYVNGLDTANLTDWILNTPGARQRWVGPQDPGTVSAYLDPNGYFRQQAKEYWGPHIRENLFDPDNPGNPVAGWQFTGAPVYTPKHNRYLLVAWSTSNTIEYAQAALLTQIQLAMSPSALNVVTPPNYPPQFHRPFCSNGCIIISHSTGPLVVSSAMGLAAEGFFGPGGKQIPGKIFAQVAFEGAISGTRFATVALAAGVSSSAALCTLFTGALPAIGCTAAAAQFLGTSVLRDLVPLVAQNVWGPAVNASPVRTVTVAGGHPSGKMLGLMKPFLPGLDDGVVSMNSACGNPNPVYPLIRAPSGAVVTSLVKAFDFSENGGRLLRSIANFISSKNFYAPPPAIRYLTTGCTPYVSPTGMVMPIADAMGGSAWDARNRYRNYYSFLQATLSHSYDGGSEGNQAALNNPWPSASGLPASVSDVRHYLNFFGFYTDNIEESMAVTDSAIYARDANGTYLVKPIPVEEFVIGRKLSFKIPRPLLYPHGRCPNRWCSWWIWKRTYDMPVNWQFKQSSHYVYEFVARR
ncbi:MAG: SH3 domain-containing protein [Devosia nanyangense]|uniref:SH3 domain-containing protein n=1 Tax=Devosia nanyangense TaxID=1228055 RepID=A0A933L4D3_9HYPH|nr:SH3 domain-containing protein [Devosia nanyangense]